MLQLGLLAAEGPSASVERVQRAGQRHPPPTVRPRKATGAGELDRGEIRRGQSIDHDLHRVQMVHGAHAFEGGRLLDVDALALESHGQHVDLAGGEIRQLWRARRVDRRVHICEVDKLRLDDAFCDLCEALFVERDLGATQLLGQQPVDELCTTIRCLLPRLQQELAFETRVVRQHLDLQDVHHTHQERHPVVSTPMLQLRLLLPHLMQQVLH
mmetsp:Transcript_97982/g.299506  ORF Transcript_97982/g.299506 Transcript_97982/m.299506 type:complete len:213 (-) Transcript_97982:959-1597(-)